jgi:hypothetical protein
MAAAMTTSSSTASISDGPTAEATVAAAAGDVVSVVTKAVVLNARSEIAPCNCTEYISVGTMAGAVRVGNAPTELSTTAAAAAAAIGRSGSAYIGTP